jgi:hypothetical protein
MADNLIRLVEEAIEAAEADDGPRFARATERFVKALRRALGRINGDPQDDLVLLVSFQRALEADPDLDDSYPAAVATMRDLLAAVDDHASMN